MLLKCKDYKTWSNNIHSLHNNPNIHPDEYRGAVIFQFMLTGAASIYYGDEAAIDGKLDSMEGCRYPMPWSKDFQSSPIFRLNQTMAHLKANHKALRCGGMKFLYADGYIFALARFCEDEVFVMVLSTGDRDETIRLPLGAVGASCPKGTADLFGRTLDYQVLDKNSINLTVKAHQAYLMECQIREAL